MVPQICITSQTNSLFNQNYHIISSENLFWVSQDRGVGKFCAHLFSQPYQNYNETTKTTTTENCFKSS